MGRAFQESIPRLERRGLLRTHSRDKADYALLWFEPGRAAAQERQVRGTAAQCALLSGTAASTVLYCKRAHAVCRCSANEHSI